VEAERRSEGGVLRPARRAPWLPPLAALLAAAVGLVNLASGITPGLSARLRDMLDDKPFSLIPLVHALELPIGASLVILAVYLRRRRRGAWALTVGILLVVGLLDAIKVDDLGEGIFTWVGAAFLAWQREAFYVRQDGIALRAALWRVPLAVGVAIGVALLAVWAGSRSLTPHVGTHRAWHEARHLLTLRGSGIHFHRAFTWVPLSVHLLAVATILLAFWFLLRPLAGPRQLPGSRARRLARDLVETHGADTLSYFKLRQDKHYLFSSDERAFVGYQIEGRALLISADPVGPADALPGLVRELFAWAEVRGLRVGVINASERTRELGRAGGLRSVYFGDEALLDVEAFSLEGRTIRKVRQSVTRMTKAGYRAELVTVGELDPTARDEIEAVSDRWRGRHPERGFSMCMDSVAGGHEPDTLLVLARDATGAIRGFVHFVPAFGRPAASLSAMRRDRDTPNGLMEFLVVRSIELMRDRGVRELSLNFAAFGRWMHAPANARERLLGRLCKPLNPFFQIESLYRFNAKFFPRWEPRYLLYEGRLGLLPTAVAAAIIEGQLPRPRLSRPRRRRRPGRTPSPVPAR